MNWYPYIKGHYDAGRYDTEDCKVFVRAGWITADQYKTITGIVMEV